MLIIDSTPQTDALARRLLTERAVSAPAMKAVRRVHELEREVTLLRGMLAALPADARRNPVWQAKIAYLLTRVALFRVALPDAGECCKPDGPYRLNP